MGEGEAVLVHRCVEVADPEGDVRRRPRCQASILLVRIEFDAVHFRGSNVLSLKWIKGEPTPSRLVDDILRGLGLERETEMQVRQRRSSLVTSPLGVGSRPSTGHATMGGGVK